MTLTATDPVKQKTSHGATTKDADNRGSHAEPAAEVR